VALEGIGVANGRIIPAQQHGHDLRIACAGVESGGAQLRAQMIGKGLKPFARGISISGDFNRFRNLRGKAGRQSS